MSEKPEFRESIKKEPQATRRKHASKAPKYRRACPYNYEIKDGHVFIEGEDFGTVEQFNVAGEQLSRLVRIWHGVKIETGTI